MKRLRGNPQELGDAGGALLEQKRHGISILTRVVRGAQTHTGPGDDHQSIQDMLGGRMNTFCHLRDDSWHQGAVSAPMMHFGEAQVLASIGGGGRDTTRSPSPGL